MNKIDLLKYKQFPMSVETLDFMQNMLTLTARLASIGGSTYIVDGCVEQGTNVSAGVVVINGEILPFEGGTKSETIIIQESKESVQVYDEQYTDIYSSRKVTFGSGRGQLSWKDFVRLPPVLELSKSLTDLTNSFNKHTHTAANISDFSSSVFTEVSKAFPTGMISPSGLSKERFLDIICAGEIDQDGKTISYWGENKINGYPFKSERSDRDFFTITHNYGSKNYAVLPVFVNMDSGLIYDFPTGRTISVSGKEDTFFVLNGANTESWRDFSVSFIMYKLKR